MGRRVDSGASATEVVDSEGAPPAGMLTLIGEMLRQARAGRYTIEQLAKASGVSAGRISQIERGIANPSFDTLWKLAAALEMPMGYFFQGTVSKGQMLVRHNERKRLSLPHDDLVYELLTPDLQRSLEVFRFSVPPGMDNTSRPIHHIGEECIHLLSGALEVQVANQVFHLGEGDSVTYNSAMPHAVANRGRTKAIAIAAVTPPSF